MQSSYVGLLLNLKRKTLKMTFAPVWQIKWSSFAYITPVKTTLKKKKRARKSK